MSDALHLSPNLQRIAAMVLPGSNVLDIGCSKGHLLAWLHAHKGVSGRGIELCKEKVQDAIAHGLSVVQGDADEDLAFFAAGSYDYVILNEILQTMQDPVATLTQAGRIARYVVVAVPNFGHLRNRAYLMFNGKMPVTTQLDYQWYETPNIHFCTMRDFAAFCAMLGFSIRQQVVLTSPSLPQWLARQSLVSNLFGEKGIFLLEKTQEIN